jgi:hypothetical protein
MIWNLKRCFAVPEEGQRGDLAEADKAQLGVRAGRL